MLWMYHGHASEAADTYAGLVGGFIVSRRGALKANGLPSDVDRWCLPITPLVPTCASPPTVVGTHPRCILWPLHCARSRDVDMDGERSVLDGQ